MTYRIELAKEDFKFSGSHFTIFSSNHAERLHGHNYQVRCHITVQDVDPSLGMAFDFNAVKPHLRTVTRALDEHVLLPQNSPFLEVTAVGDSVRVRFAQKRYEFPAEDVRLLPITNVTSEELARWIAEELMRLLRANSPNAASRIQTTTITVEETRGQSVEYTLQV